MENSEMKVEWTVHTASVQESRCRSQTIVTYAWVMNAIVGTLTK